MALNEIGDMRAVPTMIGLVDSGGSERAVRDLESHGLRRLTGVEERHDGAWWRTWWQQNRARYGEPVASMEVPTFEFGEKPEPVEPKATDTLVGLTEELLGAMTNLTEGSLSDIGRRFDTLNDPAAIPIMIAVIEARDDHAAIYGIGYYGLRGMTGVSYDEGHNGAWWREWWENNRNRYGETIAALDVPKIELDQQQAPGAISVSGDVESLTKALVDGLKSGAGVSELFRISRRLGELGDVAAIPTLIACIEVTDDTQATSSMIHHGLSELTGVGYDKSRDSAWWRTWWLENRHRYGEPYASMEIQKIEMPEQPAGDAAAGEASVQAEKASPPPEAEIEPGIHRFHAGGDPRKTYILNAPPEDTAPPQGGWKLLLVLPGGDGSEDFQAFISNVTKRGLPQGYLVAQLVAPRWSEEQASKLVWPIERHTRPEVEFTTETFIKAVVADVKEKRQINDTRVFALGWSSGGLPLYAAAGSADPPLRGVFIAMSMFKQQQMPPLEQAKGKAFYILHSPQDFIPMRWPEAARDQLAAAGAHTTLETYEGGHGWRGDVLGMIRRGVEWLEEHADQ